MQVEHVEILVEEPSMEAALRSLLPPILGNTSFAIYPYQCKDDLMKRLPERLRGYASWLPESYRIIVIVDRDDDDCIELKARLEKVSEDAGLTSRSRASGGPYQIVNRLAIEELEAWYFGDWTAVKAAYPRVPASIVRRAKYRNPDAITGGTWESFERILQRAGYVQSGLRKIEAARKISKHWSPEENRSRSFQVFRKALLEIAT